jgi:hypothetical protein
MKRFTTEGTNDQEGRELIPAHRNAEEVPVGLSFEGEAGVRTLSRRQALGLLGGSLVGVSLLSLGLTAPAKAVQPFGIIGPPGYRIPYLSYVRGGNWFNLTLQWKCVFQPSVVNHTFETQWALLEDDDLSKDDLITATVEPHPHSAYSPKKVFVPSRANPSNPEEVSFRETIGWHRDDLDTEIGNEEIYASVRLEDVTTNIKYPYPWVWSNQLNLSP